ncbi:hypothetical protein H4Q26_009326 [Puccinia striiformis f. sp. tritici PST-130]|nr:hypothetical protein H4Q26_009326 [Puccinia striiformis f. sp. tritici PST-130]
MLISKGLKPSAGGGSRRSISRPRLTKHLTGSQADLSRTQSSIVASHSSSSILSVQRGGKTKKILPWARRSMTGGMRQSGHTPTQRRESNQRQYIYPYRIETPQRESTNHGIRAVSSLADLGDMPTTNELVALSMPPPLSAMPVPIRLLDQARAVPSGALAPISSYPRSIDSSRAASEISSVFANINEQGGPSHQSSHSSQSSSHLQTQNPSGIAGRGHLIQSNTGQGESASAPATLPATPTTSQAQNSRFLPTGIRLWDSTPGLVLGDPFIATRSSATNNNDLLETRNNSSRSLTSTQPAATVNPNDLALISEVDSTSGSSTRQINAQSESTKSIKQDGKLDNSKPGSLPISEHKYQPSFSMHTIRQHIKNRLSTAKTLCDNALKAIILDITTYVEQEAQNYAKRIAHGIHPANPTSTPIHNNSITFPPRKHSAGSEYQSVELPVDRPFRTTTPSCSPRHSLSRALSIPTDFTLSPGESPQHHQRSSSVNPLDLSESSSYPKSTSLSRQGSRQGRGAGSSGSISSAIMPPRNIRLDSPIRGGSRSVSISTQPSESVDASSRSTSRSRSPLLRAIGQTASSSHRRSSPRAESSTFPGPSFLIASDEKFYNSPFVAALQDISSIATEILDTPAGVLAAKSHACVDVIHRVQQVGKSWDDHEEWPHRGWYVRVLLAVAGLSRVLEWWDAEKGFWNSLPRMKMMERRFVSLRPEWSTRGGQHASNQQRGGTPSRKTLDTFALPPPATDVDIALEKRGSKPIKDSNLKKTLALGQLIRTESSASFSEIRHPQSAGLVKPSPSPHSLDKDFTRSIDLARTETILAEVSLDNAVILYLSPGWTKVTAFNEANRRLMEDVGNTVELQLRLKSRWRVVIRKEIPVGRSPPGIIFYQWQQRNVDGDRNTGRLHSMWVIRLNSRKALVVPAGTTMDNRGSHHTRSHSDPIAQFPAPAPLSTEPCSVGYVNIIYRLTISRDIMKLVPKHIGWKCKLANSGTDPPTTLILQLAAPNLLVSTTVIRPESSQPRSCLRSSSPHHNSWRVNVKGILEEIGELLNTALDISTPSSNEEAAEQSIENLRLLSPNSENKLVSVAKWSLRAYEDPALANLAADVERAATKSVTRIHGLPKRLDDERFPVMSPMMCDDIDRPRSAPQKADSIATVSEVSVPDHVEDHRLRISPAQVQSRISDARSTLRLSSRKAGSLPLSPTSVLVPPPRSPVIQASNMPMSDVLLTSSGWILKKQDMIAKNQIMNVKSERKILMNQADSDFVVKLFYTFSSRDHLYLVMEYLNGGDCAALVKALVIFPKSGLEITLLRLLWD